MSLQENYKNFLEDLTSVPEYGSHVKIVAVSKTKPLQDMLELYECGQKIFGENKVQEAGKKKPNLPVSCDLHLIGPLQSNKVKYCPDLFSTIHSISSYETLAKLNKAYMSKGKTLSALIQMNLCKEMTKNGISDENELFQLIESSMLLENVQLSGLMTIPDPNMTNIELGGIFAKLRKMREVCVEKFSLEDTFIELSMGMSSDYKIAVREGATYIRPGSILFGERNYS